MVTVVIRNIMFFLWREEFRKCIDLGYNSRMVKGKVIPVTDRGGT
jgi:hypothetical protein